MPTFSFNRIIKILILSDFVIYSAWGLISPIFAVFLLDAIKGGDASVVGIAAGIYWITKSLLQFPVGRLLDRIKGEGDDYSFMICGTLLASLIPLGFLISSQPWHIYVLQILYALGMSMVIPPWGGIFTRHIDKGREAETWGFESSLLGLGVGIAGIAGGFIAKSLGFELIFIAVSMFGLMGVGLLLFIKKDILPKENREKHHERLRHVGHARYRQTKKVGHMW